MVAIADWLFSEHQQCSSSSVSGWCVGHMRADGCRTCASLYDLNSSIAIKVYLFARIVLHTALRFILQLAAGPFCNQKQKAVAPSKWTVKMNLTTPGTLHLTGVVGKLEPYIIRYIREVLAEARNTCICGQPSAAQHRYLEHVVTSMAARGSVYSVLTQNDSRHLC